MTINNKIYKAVLIDVDKTLISVHGGYPSKKVTETLLKAKEHVHIALATGKPYQQLAHLVENLKLSGPSIVSGGAQIVNVSTGEMYAEYPINLETIFEIGNILKETNENFWIQDNGVDHHFESTYKPFKPFAIIVHDITADYADKVLEKISQFSDISTFKVSQYDSHNFDLHISSIHATKQQGVLHLSDLLAIQPHEIIGIGDSYNDFPLLMACGLKVAMGNAVDELKEIADYVCADVLHDGVAEVIEKFILYEG